MFGSKGSKGGFILASSSPRRRELLGKAGYEFRIVSPEVDEREVGLSVTDPVEHAKVLAVAKARDVAERYPDELVMGADTVVDFEGHIIGKPADAADAERITRMLFSRPHKVITGLALVKAAEGLEIVRADVTVVYPHKLSDEQVRGHIEGNGWEGKAGAYGIQETGDEFVERIEGSFTNVMGLPMELVEEVLSGRL